MNTRILKSIPILFGIVFFVGTVVYANNFPTSLNSWTSGNTISSSWANSLEAKIGINNSAVTSSLDYILKNSSSIDPGHRHTTSTITGLGTAAYQNVSSFAQVSNNLSDLASSTAARTNLGLGNVENTALSTWTGNTSITSVGTIATGTWNATAITAAKGGAGTATFLVPHSFEGFDREDNIVISSSTVSSTVAYLGAIEISKNITVNKLTFAVVSLAGTGTTTLDFALYSEDGQTKYFDVTSSAVGSTNETSSIAVSSVALTPGIYYLGVVPNANPPASKRFGLEHWESFGCWYNNVSSEPKISGTLSVTAGTLPSTFSPTALASYNDDTCATGLMVRLDT